MSDSMLARMERQRKMERHHLHLQQIKNRVPGYNKKPGTLMPASFDNAPPRVVQHRKKYKGTLVGAYNKKKRIERQNTTLLKQFQKQQHRATLYGDRKKIGPSSLNVVERRKKLLNIVKENNILLHKIKHAPTQYNVRKWEHQHATNAVNYKHMSKFHPYDEDVLAGVRKKKHRKSRNGTDDANAGVTSAKKHIQRPTVRKRRTTPQPPASSSSRSTGSSPRKKKLQLTLSRDEKIAMADMLLIDSRTEDEEGERVNESKSDSDEEDDGIDSDEEEQPPRPAQSQPPPKSLPQPQSQPPPQSQPQHQWSTPSFFDNALRQLFHQYDNNTGMLHAAGLRSFMVEYSEGDTGLHPIDKELDVFIRFMDQDKNGSIEEDELVSFFQQAFTLDSAKKKLFSNRSEMHFKIMTLIDRVKSKILKNNE